MLKPTPRDLDRFWSFVKKSDGCWEWQGAPGPGGYGQLWYHGRQQRAHRLSYFIAHGEIPAGLMVCHRCDNRRCVRPDHLFLGTGDDNMADMVAKGRSPKGARNASHIAGGAYQRGERNGRHRFTPEQVKEIRQRSAVYRRGMWVELAREYGVSPTAIQSIALRKNWGHVE